MEADGLEVVTPAGKTVSLQVAELDQFFQFHPA